MQIFIFGSHEGGQAWGEVEEVAIIAENEPQAWEILAGHRRPVYRREDWALEEVKPLAVGVVFATSYTLGI